MGAPESASDIETPPSGLTVGPRGVYCSRWVLAIAWESPLPSWPSVGDFSLPGCLTSDIGGGNVPPMRFRREKVNPPGVLVQSEQKFTVFSTQWSSAGASVRLKDWDANTVVLLNNLTPSEFASLQPGMKVRVVTSVYPSA